MPRSCDGSEPPGPWRAGVGAGGFRTEIAFGDREVPLEEGSVVATAGYHPGPRYGLSLGLGAIVGGSANTGEAGDVGAGVLGTASGTWLAIYERSLRPFVLASVAISLSTTTAVSDDGDRHRLTAGDLRLGVMVGKTLFDRVVPYAAARAFGGPVFWSLRGDEVTGSDVHHYSVGAGATLHLPAGLDLYVELMALGERSGSAGLTLAL